MVVFRLVSVIVFLSTVYSLSRREFPYHETKINHATHAAAFNRLLNSIAKINQQRLDSIKKLSRLQELRPQDLRSDPTQDSDETSSSSEERDFIYLVIPDDRESQDSKDDKGEPGKTPTNDANHTNVTKLETNVTKQEPNVTKQEPNVTKQEPNVTKQEPNATKQEPKPDIVLGPMQDHNISDAYVTRTNESMAHMSLSRDGLEYLRQSIARSCKNKDVKRCRNACKEAVSSACASYDCKKKLKKLLKKKCKKTCKEEFNTDW